MNYRVLVVEDSTVQADVLQRALDDAGVRSGLATDGQQALDILGTDPAWDLVLTDVMMPHMDGYELCRRMKADPDLAPIPVTLLTTLDGPLDVIRGLECGADSFLTKPYDTEQLLQRIETIVRNHRSQTPGRFRMGIEVSLLGHTFAVNADRQQILDMLMSSFEELIDANQRLREREQQLVAAEDHLARTLRASRVATWTLDLTTGAFRWSDNAKEVLGVDAAVSIDHLSSFLEQLVPEDAARLHQLAQVVHEHPAALPAEWEYQVVGSDGQVRFMTGRGEPWTDAATGHVVVRGLVLDVTARKRLEAELQRARDEADAANRAKSEYLSRMSHELRTPLNTVIGFAQLMASSDLDGHDRDAASRILRAGRHLLRLVDDVLDVARIEAGRLDLDLQPTHVASALHEAAEMVRHQAADQGTSLDVSVTPPDLHVLADPHRLAQILINLVTNAVKYDDRGGAVTLRGATTGAGRIRIEVSDTGPGIAAELIDRAFTPFDRLGAERTGTVGTGLGLPLCRSLTEAMGGEMGVESTPGRGSTFWFELDAAQRPPTVATGVPPGSETAGPSAGGCVLHIEDNPSNRALVSGVFRRYPELRLLESATARDGLELIRAGKPDLVLLDLHLPDAEGLDVLEELKADPAFRPTPVVVLSADATPDRIEAARAAGAVDYLTKPLDLEELMSTVARHLADGRA